MHFCVCPSQNFCCFFFLFSELLYAFNGKFCFWSKMSKPATFISMFTDLMTCPLLITTMFSLLAQLVEAASSADWDCRASQVLCIHRTLLLRAGCVPSCLETCHAHNTALQIKVELGRHRPPPWHRTRNSLRLGASKADHHSAISGSVGHVGPASYADM